MPAREAMPAPPPPRLLARFTCKRTERPPNPAARTSRHLHAPPEWRLSPCARPARARALQAHAPEQPHRGCERPGPRPHPRGAWQRGRARACAAGGRCVAVAVGGRRGARGPRVVPPTGSGIACKCMKEWQVPPSADWHVVGSPWLVRSGGGQPASGGHRLGTGHRRGHRTSRARIMMMMGCPAAGPTPGDGR